MNISVRMLRTKIILFFLLFFVNLAFGQNFEGFVIKLKQEALTKGFKQETVDQAFANVRQLMPVIHDSKHQFQKVHTFTDYRRALVSDYRIKIGNEKLIKYADLLNKIEKQYQVPKSVIIALWGLESAFGKDIGNYPEFSALATLAYTSDRKKLFKQEIFAALTMIEDKNVPLDLMKGSWAGAMGQCQFMPSSYLQFAVAYEHPGPSNIWENKPDVFASIANFLHNAGWHYNDPILFEVTLSHEIPASLIGIEFKQPMQKWLNLGIKTINNENLASKPGLYSLIMPEGKNGAVYLVNWHNFRAILQWNSSEFYALSVGALANALNKPPGSSLSHNYSYRTKALKQQ